MKIAVISFTINGKRLADRMIEKLKNQHMFISAVKCSGVASSIQESLGEWTKEMFQSQDALIFVGAVQIAVRAIAPYIRSKTTDPAVLVFDEKGNYGIPILSGHLGGANELVKEICGVIEAQPIVTTATDINGRWAVDVFARKNRLVICEMEQAKRISASILKGNTVTVAVNEWNRRVKGKLPKEVEQYIKDVGNVPDIRIGIYEKEEKERDSLYLIPKAVVVGIGCKKGSSLLQIEQAVEKALKRSKICRNSLSKVASIDLKEQETGILEYCEKYHLKKEFYSAKELNQVPGDFSGSEFVTQVTGVDNVCERSAVLASGNGNLIMRKMALNGVTVALAQEDWKIEFE